MNKNKIVKENFWRNLQIKMAVKNVNQIEFARFTGISQSQLSHIMGKKTLPNTNTLLKMAEFFGCSLDSFFAPIEE